MKSKHHLIAALMDAGLKLHEAEALAGEAFNGNLMGINGEISASKVAATYNKYVRFSDALIKVLRQCE